MISGKQFINMIEYMLSGSSGFVPPTTTFKAVPNSYSEGATPANIQFSGTIIPNSGIFLSWNITDSGNNTVATGNTIDVLYTELTPPSARGQYPYTLDVRYEDSSGLILSLIEVETINVTTTALVGQLGAPGDNILVPGDLTPAIEAGLASTDQLQLINLFDITAVNTGRLIFVIPDSYGAVLDITDNTDATVLNQFNEIVDSANDRKIYVYNNSVTPATYHYKLSF